MEMGLNRKKWYWYISCGLWINLSLISVDHFMQWGWASQVSTTMLGYLAWLCILSSLVTLSRRFLLQATGIFLFFCAVGVWFGPFLEPPADPFEHLRRIHGFCEKTAEQVPVVNGGFWHYSMAGTVICTHSSGDTDETRSDGYLARIDWLHGIIQGILLTSLFICGKCSGLPTRWAIFSTAVAFLFFGTNRFGFFRYYSFGPTSSSLLIYWLWISFFFFKTKQREIIAGVIAALFLVPILWVNHYQEVFFLAFLVLVWLLLNFYEFLFCTSNRIPWLKTGYGQEKKLLIIIRTMYCAIVGVIFFVMPQIKFFTLWLSTFFRRPLFFHNQHAIVQWHGLMLFGKVWSLRINDTFTFIGLLILLMAVPFFMPGLVRKETGVKVRVFLLAILPFIGYFVPLINYIWISNVKIAVYYRLCYSSLFWLFFAYFLWGLEEWYILGMKKMISKWDRE